MFSLIIVEQVIYQLRFELFVIFGKIQISL